MALVTYILKVYAPVWFYIKRNDKCVDGARCLFYLIRKIQYLPEDLKEIAKKVIQRNGFFAQIENVLLSMLSDEECSDNRIQAISLIMKIREN